MPKEIKIQASLDPHHKCISVDGDGAASIKFIVDATQLAAILRSFVEFKGKLIELTLKALGKDSENARPKNQSKTLR